MGNLRHFGAADGLLSECNSEAQPLAFKARDGRLWFATQEGIAVVDPGAIPFRVTPPPVAIEDCQIDHKPVGSRLSVRMRPGQTNLEIDYTALSFIKSEQIRFKYKLEGLDSEWVEAGTRRTAYYSHLPPGSYIFRVIAANSEGVWKRKRIAAELHDSLGQHLLVIKNWAMVASSSVCDGDAAREPLTEISTAASQGIEAVRTIAYNLRPYQLERLGLTIAVRDLVADLAASSGIRLTAELADMDRIFSPEGEMSIYRIVQEALNNTIRHSGASEGRVVVSRNSSAVELRIQDNGRGFNPRLFAHVSLATPDSG